MAGPLELQPRCALRIPSEIQSVHEGRRVSNSWQIRTLAHDAISAYHVDVHDMYTREVHMGAPSFKHKHLVLDQRKINAAKRYFGVQSEQEAVDKALSLLVEEQRLNKALRPLKGVLKGDDRSWPYR